MKFTTSKKILHDNINWISKILPRNPFNPIYAGITITATMDNIVTFAATDSDSSAHSTLETAVQAPGTTMVPGRLLIELIKSFPDTDITIEKASAGVCEVYNQFSRFSFPIICTDVAPMIPPPPETIGTLSIDSLKEVTRQVASIASVPKEDHQNASILCGMKIEFTNTHITCIATDRHRFALKKVPWAPSKPIVGDPFIVAYAQQFKSIVEGLSEADKKSASNTVALAGDYDNFSTLGVVLDAKYSLSRLFSPEWVKYSRIIPQNIPTTITVSRENLLGIVKRMSLFTSGNNPRIALTVSEDSLTVTRIGKDGEGGVETIPATLQGSDITIGLNAYYLIEALGLFSSENITLGVDKPNTPVIITEPLDDPVANLLDLDYFLMVMPLNLGSNI